MSKVLIATIMRTDFPTVRPETPIRRVAARLVETRHAAAPVLQDDGQMVGLITQKDCFRSVLHASYYREWTSTASDHMSQTVVQVAASDDLIKVAEMFLAYPHRVFPVCDNSEVVGIVRRSDVLAELVRLG